MVVAGNEARLIRVEMSGCDVATIGAAQLHAKSRKLGEFESRSHLEKDKLRGAYIYITTDGPECGRDDLAMPHPWTYCLGAGSLSAVVYQHFKGSFWGWFTNTEPPDTQIYSLSKGGSGVRELTYTGRTALDIGFRACASVMSECREALHKDSHASILPIGEIEKQGSG